VASSRHLIHLLIATIVAGTTPNSFAADAQTDAKGPDVTIVLGEERTVYEYRQGGELRMIKVVPKHGLPYNLVPRDDTRCFGDLECADMLIPRWTIIEF
jgi:hypothetical protein